MKNVIFSLVAVIVMTAISVHPAEAGGPPDPVLTFEINQYVGTYTDIITKEIGRKRGTNLEGYYVTTQSLQGGFWGAINTPGSQYNDFTLLPGYGIVSNNGGAYDISNNGSVCGFAYLNPSGFSSNAVIWKDGQLLDRGLKAWGSQAFCLNDHNETVGWGEEPTPDGMIRFHAMYWDQYGCDYDLNNHIGSASQDWYLLRSDAINNDGEIFGFGRFKGQDSYFKLSGRTYQSIPETSTLFLISMSLMPIAFLRRKMLFQTIC